ncbi:hypothetical protein Ddye_005166 [Dipteronia dyeriana]|uniref:Glutathione S-transferase n=1 Tax=Dipteronia dyeriana TaxID=168575 RepID=A0AAE0CPG0_9ROSI|nr:hypothetical protein Ddye_005164 [Dipteronia dyeriana]KAK2658633.1 hypothetical protein Ddye_005166 [Dipteronia dyeriana]
MGTQAKGNPISICGTRHNQQQPSSSQLQPNLQENSSSHSHEKPICESLVIIEYSDQTWKNATPILPLDPYKKAVARFWAKFVEEKFTEVMRKVLFTKGEQQEKEMSKQRKPWKCLKESLKARDSLEVTKLGWLDLNLVGNYGRNCWCSNLGFRKMS